MSKCFKRVEDGRGFKIVKNSRFKKWCYVYIYRFIKNVVRKTSFKNTAKNRVKQFTHGVIH